MNAPRRVTLLARRATILFEQLVHKIPHGAQLRLGPLRIMLCRRQRSSNRPPDKAPMNAELRGNTRETDLIARFAGEAFVVVLPATDAETARSICERIVMAFRNTGHVIGSDHATVTISIGCATHGSQTLFNDVAEFIKAADQALYTAKMHGRNRFIVTLAGA